MHGKMIYIYVCLTCLFIALFSFFLLFLFLARSFPVPFFLVFCSFGQALFTSCFVLSYVVLFQCRIIIIYQIITLLRHATTVFYLILLWFCFSLFFFFFSVVVFTLDHTIQNTLFCRCCRYVVQKIDASHRSRTHNSHDIYDFLVLIIYNCVPVPGPCVLTMLEISVLVDTICKWFSAPKTIVLQQKKNEFFFLPERRQSHTESGNLIFLFMNDISNSITLDDVWCASAYELRGSFM